MYHFATVPLRLLFDFLNKGSAVGCAVEGRAGNQHIRAVCLANFSGVQIHAAVYLQMAIGVDLVQHGAQLLQLGHHVHHEFLPTEAGFHSHHQYQIHHGQVLFNGFCRGVGLDHNTGLYSQRADQLQCLFDVLGGVGFYMNGQVILKSNGRFYMVHRPFRLAEIFCKMVEYKIEPKRMRLVYPYIDKEPNMVLIEGLRGGRSRITVEKPLIVYQSEGKYTDEIYEIYGY